MSDVMLTSYSQRSSIRCLCMIAYAVDKYVQEAVILAVTLPYSLLCSPRTDVFRVFVVWFLGRSVVYTLCRTIYSSCFVFYMTL